LRYGQETTLLILKLKCYTSLQKSDSTTNLMTTL